VGSNSTLVAPDSLVIGRAHQLVKKGWAKKRRERK
jgi:bifunctional N-acetylglucosamine-1-phosphate-uridyltransferase/glucosamine-1-phosphate-acetyltransferase GlmU-like protein